MKRYLMTLVGIGLISSTLIAQEQKETNVHVIHFDGAELTSMDTTFASGAGFTVDDYLNLHGIDPTDAQIFELNKETDFHEFNAKDDVWMFRKEHSEDFENAKFDIVRTENADFQELKVMHFVDDEGNEEQQIWLNGEEVEALPEGVRVFEFNGNADDLKKHKKKKGNAKTEDVQLMEVQVEVFIDDNGEEHRTIMVNGEEVDELPVGGLVEENIIIEIDGDEVENGNVQIIEQNVEVIKTIDEEGNEHVQYILNGEEVDELPELPQLPEGADGQIIEVIEINDENSIPGNNMMFFGNGPTEKMTVVIVHESTRSAELPETNVDDYTLTPQNLSFYPNPNEGKFRVEFILPEEGRTKVTMYDVTGKIVWEDDLGMFSGNYSQNIDVSDEGSGTYIMRITQDNKTMAEKVIIR